MSIDSQSGTQVVVTAAAATPGAGDVVVYSTTHGVTTKAGGFTYQKADQGIGNFLPADASTFVQDDTVGLSATASSGLPVGFAVDSGPGQINSGTNLTFSGPGAVSIVASQAGDTNWYAAPHLTNTYQVLGLYTLAVESAHGSASPAVGLHTNLVNSLVTNLVVTPDGQDSTQYVCVGWSMSGHEPTTGTATQFVMTVTNVAVLTWLWDTNYWLDTEAAANGTVNVGDGWHTAGSTTAITAMAAAYYHFTNWSGDVSGGEVYANPLNLLVDGPKVITAHFQENVTIQGTPEWWLVQYGFTNDFDNAAFGDQDGDGALTWEERIAGTIPTNINSVLEVESMELLRGTNYVDHVITNSPPTYTQRIYEVIGTIISWPSVSGRLYRIAYSTAVGSGEFMLLDGATNIPATPTLNIYTNEANLEEIEFYRIDVELAE